MSLKSSLHSTGQARLWYETVSTRSKVTFLIHSGALHPGGWGSERVTSPSVSQDHLVSQPSPAGGSLQLGLGDTISSKIKKKGKEVDIETEKKGERERERAEGGKRKKRRKGEEKSRVGGSNQRGLSNQRACHCHSAS